MKMHRLIIALSIINMVLLVFLLAPRSMAAQEVAQVLRGHALQIVDDLGRVRASISLHPAQKLADGSTYPETVLLRLINENGGPNVKLSAMTDGAGILLGGEKAYTTLGTRGTTTSLKLIDKDGHEKVITP